MQLRRALGSLPALPWKFQAQSPAIATKELDPRFKDLFYNKLSDGFAYAFESLCDSLSNHDVKSLQECLEGRLYERVQTQLASMSNSGHRFRLLTQTNPQLSLHNMQVHLGVHIERARNLPQSAYIRIATLEAMKLGHPSAPQENLDHIWLYIHPEAPACLILSLDVLYRGAAPLTVQHQGKDLYGPGFELHHFRFESCPLALGTQAEVAKTDRLSTLLAPVREHHEALVSASWQLVDIDHILQGNPFVK